MKIVVDELLGDACVYIYNKQGELIYSEGFYGFTNGADGGYIRTIPVPEVEFGSSKALFNKKFKYRIVNE